MKKLFLIFVLSLSMATVSAQSYRETGTKAMVEAVVNPLFGGHGDDFLFDTGIGLTASVGYQFNPYLFLGASTGYIIRYGDFVPFMVDFRYYILDKKNTPYVGLQFGHCAELKLEGDFNIFNGGLISMPQVGYTFGDLSVSLWSCRRLYLHSTSNNTASLKSDFMLMFGLGWTF